MQDRRRPRSPGAGLVSRVLLSLAGSMCAHGATHHERGLYGDPTEWHEPTLRGHVACMENGVSQQRIYGMPRGPKFAAKRANKACLRENVTVNELNLFRFIFSSPHNAKRSYERKSEILAMSYRTCWFEVR